MILPDGSFISQEEFNRLASNAEIVEINCPHCKTMTRVEDLGDGYWLCYECGEIFNSRQEKVP